MGGYQKLLQFKFQSGTTHNPGMKHGTKRSLSAGGTWPCPPGADRGMSSSVLLIEMMGAALFSLLQDGTCVGEP